MDDSSFFKNKLLYNHINDFLLYYYLIHRRKHTTMDNGTAKDVHVYLNTLYI